jgi:hypothetical protein
MKPMTANYKKLLKEVKQLVNKIDPLGLLQQGAPSDEYGQEITKILAHLPKCETVDELRKSVFAIFLESFGSTSAGHERDYQELASALYQLRKSHA